MKLLSARPRDVDDASIVARANRGLDLVYIDDLVSLLSRGLDLPALSELWSTIRNRL